MAFNSGFHSSSKNFSQILLLPGTKSYEDSELRKNVNQQKIDKLLSIFCKTICRTWLKNGSLDNFFQSNCRALMPFAIFFLFILFVNYVI